jgi:AcrR family transcriptional regulator
VLTARGRATRQRIVAAAATIIHERGVAGTSLDDVRAVTGASKSQLYHYFGDKAALVGAVIERQVQQVLHASRPSWTASTPWRRCVGGGTGSSRSTSRPAVSAAVRWVGWPAS